MLQKLLLTEGTGQLFANKINHTITSASESKSKEKKEDNKVNDIKEIYILTDKRQQVHSLRLF